MESLYKGLFGDQISALCCVLQVPRLEAVDLSLKEFTVLKEREKKKSKSGCFCDETAMNA